MSIYVVTPLGAFSTEKLARDFIAMHSRSEYGPKEYKIHRMTVDATQEPTDDVITYVDRVR